MTPHLVRALWNRSGNEAVEAICLSLIHISADIFEKHMPFIRSSKVTVRYGKPIYLKQLPPEQKKFSGAYTRDVIIGMLKEMEQE